MRASLIAPLVAAVFCPAFAEENAAGGSQNTVAVVMDFDHQYSPVSVSAMEQELESIMRSCSLRIQWRVLDDSTSRETFSNLVMARFRGTCRNDAAQPLRRRSTTLGFTHEPDGEIIRFSEVDCDEIRNFVQPRLDHHNRIRAELVYGRALGRVLAHELYHVLTRTRTHGRTGVAKPALSASDLTAGALRLENRQSEDIRRSLLESGSPTTDTASAAR